MSDQQAQIAVAGHICLDIIPAIESGSGTLAAMMTPGKLSNVGPALLVTGGAVSNTGLSLHRLGVSTKLMGKIGDDVFGHAILNLIGGVDPALTAGMIIDPATTSGYTLVINPPDVDRIFLTCPGANDGFDADDVALERLDETGIFHFGYPPLMLRMYEHTGSETARLMRRVKTSGVVTSLDMTYPDPNTPSGRVDWPAMLAATLPHVDVYLPSLEETLFMLDRTRHDLMQSQGDIIRQADGVLLSDLSGRLLDMGVAIAGLKLGDQGIYIRTTADPVRLEAVAAKLGLDAGAWLDRELLAPCFLVDVAGTTGAGDATIAGFLAGLLRGDGPVAVLSGAVGVGASSVESPDGASGIPRWSLVDARIQAGWAQRKTEITLDGWRWDRGEEVWIGPGDRSNMNVAVQ